MQRTLQHDVTIYGSIDPRPAADEVMDVSVGEFEVGVRSMRPDRDVAASRPLSSLIPGSVCQPVPEGSRRAAPGHHPSDGILGAGARESDPAGRDRGPKASPSVFHGCRRGG